MTLVLFCGVLDRPQATVQDDIEDAGGSQAPGRGQKPPGLFRDAARRPSGNRLRVDRIVAPTNAYTGFASLYEPEGNHPPRIREAACWAHLRRVRDCLEPMAAGRSLFDVHKETGSAIAQEALPRIGDLYEIKARIAGQSAEVRHAVRQKESRPKVEAFKVRAEAQLKRIPGKSDLAKAFR